MFIGVLPAVLDLTSSEKVLVGFAGIVVLAGLLWLTGILDWILTILSWTVEALIHGGFSVWRRFFAWLPWPALLGVILAVHFLVWLDGERHAQATLLVGIFLLAVGVCACLAYFLIDQERYDVARGYKVLYNPAKGQEPAHNLLLYGPRVGLPLLLAACLASISGFALLNLGLYRTLRSEWYVFGEHAWYLRVTDPGRLAAQAAVEPVYSDFLAYSLLNVASVVDVIDLLNSNRWERIGYVHANSPGARTLLGVFRLFFTAVLLQQIISWFRSVRLLGESIRDFWSPHEPIQRRAGENLTQQGARAVDYLIVSMQSVDYLTPEQRSYLPRITLAVGPASVPLLVRHLSNAQEHIREALVETLGELQAVEALPALAGRAEDPSPVVRQAVGVALGRVFALGVPAVRKRWVLRKSFRPPLRWLPWRRPAAVTPDRDPVELAREVLEKLCEDVDRDVRLSAVKALGEFGNDGSSAVPTLLRLTGDNDVELKEQLAQALGKIKTPGQPIVSGLLQLLEDASPQVRLAAVQAAGELGVEAAAASPLLARLVQDSDEAVRDAAAEALSRIGELDAGSLPQLVAGLKSRDNLVQARAADAIGAIGPAAAEAVPPLIEALRDANDRVRVKAAWALGQMGPAAAEAVAPLAAALTDPDFRVAAEAAIALGAIGSAASPAAASLLQASEHMNPEVRRNAAFAMARVGVVDEFLAGRLAVLARDENVSVRLDALRCMGTLSAAPEAAVECLLQSLHDSSSDVRRIAVQSLAQLQLPADKVVPSLLPLLDDVDAEVQAEAAIALGTLEPAPVGVVTALGQALRNDRDSLQVAAAKALGQIGEPAHGVIDDLRYALERGSASVREQVLRAVTQIQPDDGLALCLAAMHDPSPEVRRLASAGLVRPGAEISVEVLHDLAEGLHDPDPQIRANLAQLFSMQDSIPAVAVMPLLACTADPDDGLRLNALRALRGATDQLTTELPRLLEDPNPQIVFVAASYLLMADPTHPGAAAILKRALAAPVVRDRRQALDFLEQLGEKARPFWDALRTQVEKEDDAELRERGQRILTLLELSEIALSPASGAASARR